MIAILKEDFERSLPVGASAHDEVFEAVYPAIEAALNNYYDMLLGELVLSELSRPTRTNR